MLNSCHRGLSLMSRTRGLVHWAASGRDVSRGLSWVNKLSVSYDIETAITIYALI